MHLFLMNTLLFVGLIMNDASVTHTNNVRIRRTSHPSLFESVWLLNSDDKMIFVTFYIAPIVLDLKYHEIADFIVENIDKVL